MHQCPRSTETVTVITRKQHEQHNMMPVNTAETLEAAALTRVPWTTPAMFLPLADYKKLHSRKNWQSVCRTWLMSHGSSIGHGEVTQGKPGVTSMAYAAGDCSRENPAWLTYAANGNIALSERRQRLFATRDLDLLPQNKWASRTHRRTSLCRLVDPRCTGFWDIVRINKHTSDAENPTPATAVGVGNQKPHCIISSSGQHIGYETKVIHWTAEIFTAAIWTSANFSEDWPAAINGLVHIKSRPLCWANTKKHTHTYKHRFKDHFYSFARDSISFLQPL